VALQNLARVTRLVHTMLGCKGAFKSIPDIMQAAKTSRRWQHMELYSISQLKTNLNSDNEFDPIREMKVVAVKGCGC
jgi:hypothetical protein